MCKLLKNIYFPPFKVVNIIEVDLRSSTWTVENKKYAQLNYKHLNFFFGALKYDVYMFVSTRKISKEIWDNLCVAYDGTCEIKNSRCNFVLHDYKVFTIVPHEYIIIMFTHFTKIINSLHCLGHIVINSKIVSKILCFLPKSWDVKVMTIPK